MMLPFKILPFLSLIAVRPVVGYWDVICNSDGNSNIQTAATNLAAAYQDIISADYPDADNQAELAQSYLTCVIGLQTSSLETSQLLLAREYLGNASTEIVLSYFGAAQEYLDLACDELYPFCT
jgi:hypothetical protein